MEELWQTYRNTKYEISNYGSVRRGNRTLKPQKVGPYRNYLQVRLFDGTRKNGRLEYIHRMVAETFIGKIPTNMTINHIDENPNNNYVGNLEIVSAFDNTIKNVLNSVGKGRIKLTPDIVKHIRQNKHIPAKIYAEQYNCNLHTIYGVRRGDRWGWVS